MSPDEPPYVDTHSATIAAPRDVVWAALRAYADSALRLGGRHPLGRLLKAEPAGGFAVAREVPGRELSLVGRHVFARYRLVFDLADTADGETLVSAHTHAAFPGPQGRVYRALVIGSRAHVVAVRWMLRGIRHRSLAGRA